MHTPAGTSRVPRPHLTGRGRRRAGAPGAGGVARLCGDPPGLRLLRGQRRRPPGRRVPRRRPHARADDSARPGRQPQRRPAAVRAGRRALPLDRRRRHPGGSRGRRSEPELAAREDPEVRRGSASAIGRRSTPLRPTLRTRVPRRQRVLRLRGAVAYVRCSEACTVFGGRDAAHRRPQAAPAARHRRGGKASPQQAAQGPAQEALRAPAASRARTTAAARGCRSGCVPAMPRATTQPWSVARFACAARRRSRKRRSTGLVASSRARP